MTYSLRDFFKAFYQKYHNNITNLTVVEHIEEHKKTITLTNFIEHTVQNDYLQSFSEQSKENM